MNIAYVAVGSNLDNPLQQVIKGIDAIQQCESIQSLTASSLYTNAAIGPGIQPDYVNAAVRIKTRLLPHELLTLLQSIEYKHGRRRIGHQWSPRTLDLDIALFNDTTITTTRLTIPHPRMKARSFVILPLLEIEPSLSMPDGTRLDELIDTLREHPMTKLDMPIILDQRP